MSVEEDHKAATWVQFIARLMDTTYRTAKKVRWVMDNFSTHKPHFFSSCFPPDVAKAYLDRMETSYTAVHGSWLNMAELEFSVLTRQELDRSFANLDQVRQVVERWEKAKKRPLKARQLAIQNGRCPHQINQIIPDDCSTLLFF